MYMYDAFWPVIVSMSYVKFRLKCQCSDRYRISIRSILTYLTNKETIYLLSPATRGITSICTYNVYFGTVMKHKHAPVVSQEPFGDLGT